MPLTHKILLIIYLLFFLLCVVWRVYGEEAINVKVGFQDILCEGADGSPLVEISYEYKADINELPDIGVELGIGGISAILHDTQTGTEYVGKAMGRLNVINAFGTLKVYLPFDLYVGSGVGYYWTMFAENHRIYKTGEEADADNEIEYHFIGGWNITDEWFIEGKYVIGDLDIESNIFPAGILEAHSRLNSYSVTVGRKWKF